MLLHFAFYSSYFLPLLLLLLYRNSRGARVLSVSSPGLLLVFYLLTNHLGLVVLYHAEDGIKQLSSVDRSTVLLLSSYSSIVVIVYIFTDVLFRHKFRRYRRVIPQYVGKEKFSLLPIFLLLVITATLAIMKFLDDSPLKLLLAGDIVGGHGARVAEYSENTWFLGIKPSYIKTLFEIAQFFVILMLVMYAASKRLLYLLLYIAFLFVVMLESMTNTAKGAIVTPIYQVWVMYAVLYAGLKLNNRVVLYGFVFALTIVVLFTAYMMNGGVQISWTYPFMRLFLGNLLPQYVAVDHFGWNNLLTGTSLPAWLSLGLHEQFLLDEFVWKDLMQWNGGPFYTAPSSFVAHAHANFHVYGVIANSFLLFVILRVLDLILVRVRSNAIYAALLIYTSLHFSYWSVGGNIAIMILFDYYYIAVLMFVSVFFMTHMLPSNREKPDCGNRTVANARPISA